MPVFDYSVKKNGKWYRPGEEVPETETPKVAEQEVPETETSDEPKPRKKKADEQN